MKIFQFFTLLTSKYKNYQTIFSKRKDVDHGAIKYLPSFSKEWKNTIYAYNKDTLKNIPVHMFNLNNNGSLNEIFKYIIIYIIKYINIKYIKKYI